MSQPFDHILKYVTVKDFQTAAKKLISNSSFEYYRSGAEDQIALKENVSALNSLKLNPRVLVDMSNLKFNTKFLGRDVGLPFGVAPTASHKLAHKDGEKILASLAAEKSMVFTLSTLSSTSMRDIQVANKDGIRLMQIYVLKDRQRTLRHIKLAEQYGFFGIAITVDAQVFGKRINNQKNKFITNDFDFEVLKELGMGHLKFVSAENKNNMQISFNESMDKSLDWEFLKQIRKATKLPIILKGILSVEDAVKAHEEGVDAVWVSNHGGRQLDSVLSTVQALPPIVSALKKLGSKMEIYVDGGVNKGSDIFKFLALGANYVFVGRGLVYSLVEGYEGASRVIDILQSQLKTTMMLCGTPSISSINQKFILPKTFPKL